MTSDVTPRYVTRHLLKGKMEYAQYGVVQCVRYVGRFISQKLQDKADTGLWYTLVQGNPFVPQGEGTTPEYAVRDSIIRSEDLMKKLQQGVQTMKAALGDAK